MDIDLYLKTAFHVSSSIYRDFASYLLKDDVKKLLMNPAKPTACDRCGSSSLKFSKTQDGFTVSCESCGSHSGAAKRTEAQSIWAWYAKKDSQYDTPPTILRDNTYSVLNKRMGKNPRAAVTTSVEWLAAINFVDWIWKIQSKSGDFKALDDDSKLFVETLITALGVVKRQAVQRLESTGLAVSEKRVLELLNMEKVRILKDRKSYYPRYQNDISLTMRCKMSEAFEQLK